MVFHCDALTCHLRQAVYMAIRGDFTHGGIMSDSEEVRATCVCDGQFSEDPMCRAEDSGYFNAQVNVRDVCPPRLWVLGNARGPCRGLM